MHVQNMFVYIHVKIHSIYNMIEGCTFFCAIDPLLGSTLRMFDDNKSAQHEKPSDGGITTNGD
jgi:hypothetical protein